MQSVMEDWCNRRTQIPQVLLEQKYATCKHGVRASVQTLKKEAGAKPVPQPVTTTDLLGNHVDEGTAVALGLGSNRLGAQSPLAANLGTGKGRSKP